MNYLWDIALRARQQGIDEKDLFFCSGPRL